MPSKTKTRSKRELIQPHTGDERYVRRKGAFSRAARAAFTWPDEAADIVSAGKSLTGLQGVGPSIARRLLRWLDSPPSLLESPPIRREFLTLARAQRILARNSQWERLLKGDLQMHTVWSDGSGTILHMAEAAMELGYRLSRSPTIPKG